MVEKEATRKRPQLVCLSLNVEDVYKKAKLLAHHFGRSVSSYIRELIKQDFKRNKEKLESTEQ